MANNPPIVNLQPVAPPPIVNLQPVAPSPPYPQVDVTNSLNLSMVILNNLQQGQQQLQQGLQQLQQGLQQLQQGQQQLQQLVQQNGVVLNNIQQLLQQAVFVGAVPTTVEERNAARRLHNIHAARDETALLPIFSAAGLLPNVLFPQTVSALYAMTNAQLAALLGFYNLPGVNANKAVKITRLRRFIIGE